MEQISEKSEQERIDEFNALKAESDPEVILQRTEEWKKKLEGKYLDFDDCVANKISGVDRMVKDGYSVSSKIREKESENIVKASSLPEVVRIIGKNTCVTLDYRPSRLNIHVLEDGLIQRVYLA
ncbi:hypothetical protein AX774_g7561 [Zancudomyces culisetae]|uniref:Uncharacterized protein n=1 Tax=Zancudomyces culisetae TaxID=1213189 RepID=A0A1R1PDG1_ZANCU|nr:hypothetical protein AX774_g7561 [Zancudomyces culisetae]|eukprot:OMH79035.1 hypothetical protein AX774_g7561 [Zancudomyces culisetae]